MGWRAGWLSALRSVAGVRGVQDIFAVRRSWDVNGRKVAGSLELILSPRAVGGIEGLGEVVSTSCGSPAIGNSLTWQRQRGAGTMTCPFLTARDGRLCL